MRIATDLLVIVLVGVALAAAFPYTGLYNVAASEPHRDLMRWALETTMRHSVERRAHTRPPGDLDDARRVRRGSSPYAEMCAMCHAAPGKERSTVGKGMNPEPPELAHAADEWTAPELFWITKHGVKMAGMPAFGETHGDEELWDLVAFVQALPRLSAPEYESMVGGVTNGNENRSQALERPGGHGH